MERSESRVTLRAEAWQARSWIAQDNLGSAARWAKERGLSVEDELDHSRESELEHIALARLLIAQGKSEEAARPLGQLLDGAETGGRMGIAIETLTLKALALQAQNDEPNTLAVLQRALSLAEPEGYVRTFADEGAPMVALLKRLLKAQMRQQAETEHSVSPGYVRNLLEALGGEGFRGTRGLLVEPLSERELEVLELLASDLSNREISAKLYVSLDTVKSHLKQIYGKLGVRSHHQAVDRAKAWDLLR